MSMFHNVPGVPHVKMEQVERLNRRIELALRTIGMSRVRRLEIIWHVIKKISNFNFLN